MPQDANRGIDQESANYLLRMALYMLLGGVADWLSHSRRQALVAHRYVAHSDDQSGLANQVALNEGLHKRHSQPK
ncbi:MULTISPECIES: hypothetical protein [Halomonadaceae]|nr:MULTISPECIES: hypothetical protein [Halomonas]